MSDFTIINRVLNMYLSRIQNPVKDLRWSVFLKIIMLFNYFCKKLHLKSLRGSEYVSGFNCVRVLNTGKFS